MNDQFRVDPSRTMQPASFLKLDLSFCCLTAVRPKEAVSVLVTFLFPWPRGQWGHDPRMTQNHSKFILYDGGKSLVIPSNHNYISWIPCTHRREKYCWLFFWVIQNIFQRRSTLMLNENILRGNPVYSIWIKKNCWKPHLFVFPPVTFPWLLDQLKN